MQLLSIDFGTTNTVAGLAIDGQPPRTIEFDASPRPVRRSPATGLIASTDW